MKNEVQKIREEVEKLILRGAYSSQVVMDTRCKEEAYNEVLAILDTMQEEPVCSVWHDVSKETPIQGSNILMVRKEEKDTNYPPIAGCFHGTNSRLDGRNWGYYNGFCYNEIEPPLKWAYIDDLLNLSNVQKTVKDWKEPVSEELEEVIRKYEQRLEKENPATEAYDFASAIRFGANWQKQQFEKNRLKHCNSITNEQAELEQGFIDQHLDKYQRMPTYLDAIEYGMKLQKEQMMAKAIDSRVYIDAGGYPYIPQMELYDYDKDVPLAKEGDKYKVILIKEK